MFAKGDRVALVHTNDPYTQLRPGDTGTVQLIRRSEYMGITQICVAWDSGSQLMLIPEDGDQIRKIA